MEGITSEKKDPKGKVLFQVKWVGFKKPTWEPEENLTNAQDIIKKWRQKRKIADSNKIANPRPSKRRRKV